MKTMAMTKATAATATPELIDLDRLVESEENAAADAAAFVKASVHAAARDLPVDETRLVAALRYVGHPVADFASEVRRLKNRLADVARVAGLPELTQSMRDIGDDQKRDDVAMAPLFDAYHKRSAARRLARASAAESLSDLEQLKRDLFRSQPDAALLSEHARLRAELHSNEREMQSLRDRRHIAEGRSDPTRFHEDAVEDARATLATVDAALDQTRDEIESSKLELAGLEEQMSTS